MRTDSHEWDQCPWRVSQSSLAPFTMWDHNEKLAVCRLAEGSQQNPTMLHPGLRLSDLQNEKYISIVFKLPGLWYFCYSSPNGLWQLCFE